MADKPKNSDTTNITSTIGSEDVKWAEGYYDIQKKIEASLGKQNNTLLSMFGIKQDMNVNIIENFRRTTKLNDSLKTARENELVHIRKMVKEEGAKRDEMERAYKAMVQYREDLEMHLQLLQNMRTSAWMPLAFVISHVKKLFESLDTAAWEFGKAMGMTRGPAEHIRVISEKIAIDFMHIGVRMADTYEAAMDLGKEMGSIHYVTSDLIKTTAILKSQLGVAADHSAGFFRMMSGISNSTMKSQENIAYMTADLAAAAGVPLDGIMSDISKSSGHTLTMMSRLPNQIMRSAIELKRMGTSLKDASNSSREILNFTDSVNAEMEASVLLGRSINLQHARELAYRRNLEESTKEILRLSNSISFENLDVFQQEAFARATGKSVDELMRMLQAEKQMREARNSSDPKIRAQVAEYEKLRDANQAIAKASGENLKSMIQQKANQERITAISAKWEQLTSKMAFMFLPIVDKFLGFIVDNFEGIVYSVGLFTYGLKTIIGVAGILSNILSVVGMKVFNLGGMFKSIGNFIQTGIITRFINFISTINEIGGLINNKIVQSLMIAGRYGTKTMTIGEKFFMVIGKIGSVFSKIGVRFNIFKSILPFFRIVTRVIPIIGSIVTAFQFLFAAWEGFTNTQGGFWSKLWGGILAGVTAVVKPIFDLLMWPFRKAWELISSLWSGHSPSELGLSIVKGITSVGTMIFDALTSPWRLGLAWIMDKIPGMGKVAEKLRGGLTGILKEPLENKINNTYVPATTIAPNTTKADGDKKQRSSDESKSSEGVDTSNNLLQDILVAINNLNKNLESGKIGFYIDGQLMSATLARQTEFRGGYGTNRA